MKTKSLLLATVAASLAGSVAFGAVSSNIVGYTKLTLNPGLSLVANTLNAADNHYHSLFASIPLLSTVYVWNGSGFDTDQLVDNTPGAAIWTANDSVLNPGQSVFIGLDSSVTAPASIYLVGSVQATGSVAVKGAGAYNFVSSVLPIAGDLVKDLSYTPQALDTVFTWNVANQSYDTTQYVDGFGWTGSADQSAPQLAIGQGIIIQSDSGSANATWSQTLPASN